LWGEGGAIGKGLRASHAVAGGWWLVAGDGAEWCCWGGWGCVRVGTNKP
jgi:hypothetical protein